MTAKPRMRHGAVLPPSKGGLWRFIECAVAGRDSLAVYRALRILRRMERGEKGAKAFREDAGYDDDPSIDCCDFCWADLALAEDYSKCCEMCYNFDEQTKKCKLD